MTFLLHGSTTVNCQNAAFRYRSHVNTRWKCIGVHNRHDSWESNRCCFGIMWMELIEEQTDEPFIAHLRCSCFTFFMSTISVFVFCMLGRQGLSIFSHLKPLLLSLTNTWSVFNTCTRNCERLPFWQDLVLCIITQRHFIFGHFISFSFSLDRMELIKICSTQQ